MMYSFIIYPFKELLSYDLQYPYPRLTIHRQINLINILIILISYIQI